MRLRALEAKNSCGLPSSQNYFQNLDLHSVSIISNSLLSTGFRYKTESKNCLKGRVHPKMNIQSLSAPPQNLVLTMNVTQTRHMARIIMVQIVLYMTFTFEILFTYFPTYALIMLSAWK